MTRVVAALAAVLLLAAAGCGDDDASSAPGAARVEPLGDKSAGSVVQFVDCGDWRRGSRAQRYATIVALRGRLTPETSKTNASPLSDDRAYAAFQNTCSQGIDSLRLYKLYIRMQGFAPLSG